MTATAYPTDTARTAITGAGTTTISSRTTAVVAWRYLPAHAKQEER